MADTQNLVDQLSGLTVLEIADLVKQLEEKWGVSAAAPVAVAAAGAPAGGAAAPPAEEKTAFDVILKEAGAQQDRGHQGSPRRGRRPRPRGGQGSRRERSQDPQGRRHQGRSRGDQEKDRSRRRQGRNQVRFPYCPRKPGMQAKTNTILACVPGAIGSLSIIPPTHGSSLLHRSEKRIFHPRRRTSRERFLSGARGGVLPFSGHLQEAPHADGARLSAHSYQHV